MSSGTANMNPIDLRSALPNDEARSALLSSARKEMYDALNLFHDHVKHSLSLMFAVLTAVFAVIGIIMQGGGMAFLNPGVIRIFAGAVLMLLFPMGIISSVIIARYYRLYVAALIYAAELHESVGLATHAWFRQIKEYREKLGKDSTLEAVMQRRTYGWPHTWLLYAMVIWVISGTGLVLGLLVLFAV